MSKLKAAARDRKNAARNSWTNETQRSCTFSDGHRGLRCLRYHVSVPFLEQPAVNAVKNETLDVILSGLMTRYQERVPDVSVIVDLMREKNLVQSVDDIQNDHVAFRTMGVPQLGIASLEKIFLHCGYVRRDAYHFSAKKLDAFWYAPPEPRHPRIFVSELRVDDLSPEAQRIIRSYTDEVPSDPVAQLDLDDGAAVDAFLHRPLWRMPTLADFDRLAQESEYASWVIYNRYYLNHFTISVHDLPAPYCNIEAFDALLEEHGIRLNDAGGKIKTSKDGLLRQSSTVARRVKAVFDDGDGGTTEKMIPGSYVEFAERNVLPEFDSLSADQVQREHRRDGFETGNADKIFESTYRSQVDG